MAVRIAPDEEIRWWNLIPSRAGVQEASFTFLDSALHAADDFITVPERSKSIITVCNNVRLG